MTTPIAIELFSATACHRCSAAKKRIQVLIDELADDRVEYRELDVLEQLDYAVSLGILSTPSIAINGELVFSAMPSLKRFRDELQKRLASL
tara:strand:+ start:13788 stop:14060 length:273 start_codon:yes stop_codon:yes gene_type:complete